MTGMKEKEPNRPRAEASVRAPDTRRRRTARQAGPKDGASASASDSDLPPLPAHLGNLICHATTPEEKALKKEQERWILETIAKQFVERRQRDFPLLRWRDIVCFPPCGDGTMPCRMLFKVGERCASEDKRRSPFWRSMGVKPVEREASAVCDDSIKTG